MGEERLYIYYWNMKKLTTMNFPMQYWIFHLVKVVGGKLRR